MAPLQQHLRKHVDRTKYHLRNAFIAHEGNDHRPHALRHKALTFYALAIIVVKVVVSGALLIYPGPSATSNLTPTGIIQLTNQARVAQGLKPLSTNSVLMTAAQFKANDMLTVGYFAHISPTNVTPWYWFKRAGYNYSSAGENLAMDFVTAEDVTQAWLNSPSHRANLLNSRYVDIGVAVASGKLNGLSTTIVVQFFGAPTPVVQTPKTVTKVVPVKPKAATKPSTVATKSPPTPVLGDSTTQPAPIAPIAPKITSPTSGTVLGTAQPWIGGESQPNVGITLYSDGSVIARTTSDSLGYFRVQPSANLSEGGHTVTAQASAADLVSAVSNSITMSVDTQPPSASLTSIALLPSYQTPGAVMVVGTVKGSDIAQADLRLGSATVPVTLTNGKFVAEVKPENGSGADGIVLELRDTIGNTSAIPAGSLSFLNVEVVQPNPTGLLALIPKLVFFSRTFFLTMWFFVFMVLAINVLVKYRVQHRATILYSLLLLYGLSVVIVTSSL